MKSLEFAKATIVAGCVSGAVLLGAPEAGAVPIVGTTVNKVGPVGVFGVGTIVPASLPDGLLTGAVTEYFIPLTSAPLTCTYGVDCGTASDSGTGGTAMSMFLEFTPTVISTGGTLEILFADLDLINANDPVGFLESLEIFAADGITSLTSGVISDLNLSALVSAPAPAADNIVTLTLAIAAAIVTDPFYVELIFRASSPTSATNTAEYLTATFDQSGALTTIPLPAALPLFGTALAGMGFIGWRRKRKAAV